MRKIIKLLAITIGFWFLGFMFLGLSSSIDQGRLTKNLQSTINTFQKEGAYPKAGVISNATLDNFTDALMILIATDPSPLNLDKVLLNPRDQYVEDGKVLDPHASLIKKGMKNHSDQDEFVKLQYPRYWHGYVTFLKPLLVVLDYKKIRILISTILGILAITVISLLFKLNIKRYIVPFIFTLLSLSPIAVGKSMQFSSVIIIALSASIAILYLCKINHLEKNYEYVFLISGIFTSFFDFLTCPILSLGYPLIFFILCYKNKKVINSWIITFKSGCCWLLGYLGMWVGKWFFASTLTEVNVYKQALGSVIYRMSSTTGSSGSHISFVDVIWDNLIIFNSISHNLFLAGVLTFFLVFMLNFIQRDRTKDNLFGKLFIVCLMPFVWYLFVTNHSFTHSFFTNRNLSITLFVLFCVISDFVYQKLNKRYVMFIEKLKKNSCSIG